MYWALRSDQLCDPGLCPDAPDDDGQHCDHCPLDRLDAAQSSELGILIRRAIELMAALKLGISVGLEEIHADEFSAMTVVQEEQGRWEREQLPDGRWPTR